MWRPALVLWVAVIAVIEAFGALQLGAAFRTMGLSAGLGMACGLRALLSPPRWPPADTAGGSLSWQPPRWLAGPCSWVGFPGSRPWRIRALRPS